MIRSFSITQAVGYAFKAYSRNWRFFFTLFGILFLIILGLDFLNLYFHKNMSFHDLTYDLLNLFKIDFSTNGILKVFFWIAIFFYFALLNKLFLENVDNQFNLNKFFKLDVTRISYFIISFVYHLMVTTLCIIPIFIIQSIVDNQANIWFYQFLLLFAGFLILLFPAIFIASKYLFADYFALEKDVTSIQSFNESSKLTYGQITKLTFIFYAIILIGIPAYIATSMLFFFILVLPFSIFSRVIGYYEWPDYFISTPINTFSIFFIFGFIIPIILLIKLSIYKQLLGNTK